MKKYILIINLFASISFAKSQVLIDCLNITPNPFIKRTCIYYCFTNNDTVSLKVFDISGNIILTLLNNIVIPSGNYQDSLTMDAFPDGIYFVQMKLGNRKTLLKKILKSNTDGISENSAGLENIKFYPNPTSGQFFIETTKRISILNSLGQLVYSLGYLESKQEIDISYLPNAIYYLKVEDKFEYMLIKMVKE